MTLAALIRKRDSGEPANANPAKAANDEGVRGEPLARLATLVLANRPESANRTPADERVEKVVGKLQADPGLRYALETHIHADPEAVILSVAIRGKGACELRIPKSRYDALALLELIEKHTTRETLQ